MSKVMPLEQAIARYIKPGDTIHVAYADARPNAALLQLAREFEGRDPQFTLVTAGMVSVQHALVEMGLVRDVAASFIGENFPAARPSPAFQRSLDQGRVKVSNWSMWGLIARLMAGGLGIPFMPVRSITGSSMAQELGAQEFALATDPFGGEDIAVVSALRPDVVILHGVAADEHGNIVTSAPYGEAHWGAMAAKRGVIASVERIVSADEVRRHQALVRIPAHLVVSVSQVRFGAHPYGMFNPGLAGVPDYVEDADFMGEVRSATRSEEAFGAWIAEWVTGTASHQHYLEKLGTARLTSLIGQAAPGVTDLEFHRHHVGPPSPMEEQVVAASRRVAERIEAGSFQVVLAGVGLANLASWLAWAHLREAGTEVELMAEIGMYGYEPTEGEPFIFSHRNLPSCAMLSDVPTVLGGLVSGPASRCLGVLGAGEVDQAGNANSTYGTDGRFIVGSGGANDIASGADEVLLTVAHPRLVETTGYVTSPGGRVASIVTSAGVFERTQDGFSLVRWLTSAGESLEEAVASMRAQSPWRFDVSPDARPEPAPTDAELARLRAYDPEAVFLGHRSKGPGADRAKEEK